MASLVFRVDGGSKNILLPVSELPTTTVAQLRSKAAEVSCLDPGRLNLLYCGRLLTDASDERTLDSLGIKSGSTVHILKKPEPNMVAPMEPKTLTDVEMHQFFVAFGMALRNPALNVVIKRLTERENLESLAAACPGLASDPLALALLSKPEMLLMLLKPEILQKVAKEHPSLCEAMVNLAAAVHEEKPSASSAEAPSALDVPAPFSYHLDEMSDVDDEMDDEDDGGMDVDGGLQRNRSFSAITPEQLAAAIAAAQGNAGASAGGSAEGLSGVFRGMTGMSPAAPPIVGPSRSTLASPAITTDMFRAAMEQAMAAATQGTGSSANLAAGNPSGTNAGVMEKNLQTMKEMGIVDENLAKKALEVMAGDLQAAIDLIFSGWLGEDENTN